MVTSPHFTTRCEFTGCQLPKECFHYCHTHHRLVCMNSSTVEVLEKEKVEDGVLFQLTNGDWLDLREVVAVRFEPKYKFPGTEWLSLPQVEIDTKCPRGVSGRPRTFVLQFPSDEEAQQYRDYLARECNNAPSTK